MNAISSAELRASMAAGGSPLLVDVRRAPAFLESGDLIAGALRRDPEAVDRWAQALPRGSDVVVYCVHGHQVSQGAAKALADRGIRARFLEGGIEHWKEEGGALDGKPKASGTRWVTRERPKVDRIACPWLVARFVDPGAEFLYVPSDTVRAVAAEKQAIPYDVPDVHFTHQGDLCSFDAFIAHYGLGGDPALARLALIVRGADTGKHELAKQSAGLVAMSLGLSRLIPDDHAMLKQGMVLYDALYAWCRDGQDERHTWNPEVGR